MADYKQYIPVGDVAILESLFKPLFTVNVDLKNYDIWIYHPSSKKLEKGYKYTKSIGDMLYLYRIIDQPNLNTYVSNTIVEIGKVLVFYGHAPALPPPKKEQIGEKSKKRLVNAIYKEYKKNH